MLYISVGLDAPKFDYSFEVKLPYMYESEREVKSEDFVFYMTVLGIAVCTKTEKGKACENPNLIPFDPEFVQIQGIISEDDDNLSLLVYKVVCGQTSFAEKALKGIDVDAINAACKNVKISKSMVEIMNEYKAMGYQRPFIQCRLTAIMFHKVDGTFHPEMFVDSNELRQMVDIYKTTLLDKIERSLRQPVKEN